MSNAKFTDAELIEIRAVAKRALDLEKAENVFGALMVVFDAKQATMEELALMNHCGDQLATKYPAEPARAVAAYDRVIAVDHSLKTDDLIDRSALSPRVLNNLIDVLNIETNKQLAAHKLGELNALPRIGPTSLYRVYKYLEERGYQVNRYKNRADSDMILAEPKAEVSSKNSARSAITYAREARQRAMDTAQIISLAKGLGLMADITQLPALLVQLKAITAQQAAISSATGPAPAVCIPAEFRLI